jgi:hypothetical protein
MESSDSIGKVEHHLWHERAGLEIAPSLELEQVSLCPDYHTLVEALANPSHGAIVVARQRRRSRSQYSGMARREALAQLTIVKPRAPGRCRAGNRA